MKRVVALLYLICCLWTSTVYSADIDLSGYSVDELLELRKMISEELSNKGYVEKVNFPNGTYECGVDIKPGRYLFSVEGEEIYGHVAIYDSMEDRENGNSRLDRYINAEQPQYMDFNEGDYILVYYGDGTLYIEDASKSDAFWAP